MVRGEALCDALVPIQRNIMLTSPNNVYPLTPHFNTVKIGLTGVYVFPIFALKHNLWLLVRTASMIRKKKIKQIHLNIIIFKLQHIT